MSGDTEKPWPIVYTEDMARHLMALAIGGNQCADLLNALGDGGAATFDPIQGKLVFATPAMLKALMGGLVELEAEVEVEVSPGDSVKVWGKIERVAENGDLMIEIPGLRAEPYVRCVVVRPTLGVVEKTFP